MFLKIFLGFNVQKMCGTQILRPGIVTVD